MEFRALCVLRVSALTRLLLILSASEDREESLSYRERKRGTVVRGGARLTWREGDRSEGEGARLRWREGDRSEGVGRERETESSVTNGMGTGMARLFVVWVGNPYSSGRVTGLHSLVFWIPLHYSQHNLHNVLV